MKIHKLILSTLLLNLLSSGASAQVSVQDAARLGNELTPIGALAQANKEGTIPAYQGGLAQDVNADTFKDIYANEAPLFVITSKNVSQYKDNLSSGQLALFAKYPNTYKMPVYKTHRTASFPESVYKKAKKNATRASLVSGGGGLKDFDETVPFAIPKSGIEVIWNHVSRFRGGAVERNTALMAVQRNADFTPVKMRVHFTPPQYIQGGYSSKADDNVLFYYMEEVKSPARMTGNILLVHETIDQISQPRMAWTYNAGQRRVRRAPYVAYDAPGAGTESLRTADQLDMYNGAPDRYDWELVGKKEIYIPYNAYKLADPELKYKNIVQAGHINQNLTRYELHRVWQVEARLKEGSRHIYSKRTFYVDEDSWQIAMVDQYDKRGELWRISEGHPLQFVAVNTPWYVSNVIYDLFSGRYLIELNNEEQDPVNFGVKMKRKSFTAAAIRRKGKR